MSDPALGFHGVPFLKTRTDTEPTLLTDAQRKELARIGKRLRLATHAIIYREGARADSVFVVGEGVVKSYRELRRRKRIVCAFLFRHDLFGLAEHGLYLNSAEAVTHVTLYQLPLGDLIPLIKRDAELQFKFLMKVTQGVRESQRRAILVNRRDAVGRLAMFLMMMRVHHDDAIRQDHDIALPMSRTDIADFLDLSRTAISRAATGLERRGIVKFENRHLARILDRPSLAKLAAAV